MRQKKESKKPGFIVVSIVLLSTTASYTNTKKAIYPADEKGVVIRSFNSVSEPVIYKNDLLSISTSSLSTQIPTTFYSPDISCAAYVTNAGSIARSNGYLINARGFIKFPFSGKIKAEGLTENRPAEDITQALLERKSFPEQIVNVCHLNFKITVPGKVTHPTVVNVSSKKISLLEAIGLVGNYYCLAPVIWYSVVGHIK